MLCGDTARHQLYSDFTAEQLALLGEGTIPVARLIINESSILAQLYSCTTGTADTVTVLQYYDSTIPYRTLTGPAGVQ